jgi:16S rRNA (cytosine1402-N4)-methyltransferase
LKTCSSEHGWDKVNGVLLDLGVSSPQLETAGRGFSFRAEGPLDMRMDRRGGPTAADLVNELSEGELTKLFYEHGGEREARRVARALAARRRRAPFRTTTDLAAVVAETLPHRRVGGIHPATKVFQALRIAVNGEQEALLAALPQAVEIMQPGGVLAVISFHSGEDRAVKHFMRERSSEWLDTPGHPNTLPNPKYHLRDMKRYLPGEEEILKNPRARSARLRVAIRNGEPIS